MRQLAACILAALRIAKKTAFITICIPIAMSGIPSFFSQDRSRSGLWTEQHKAMTDHIVGARGHPYPHRRSEEKFWHPTTTADTRSTFMRTVQA
jgi:hypothetical protein